MSAGTALFMPHSRMAFSSICWGAAYVSIRQHTSHAALTHGLLEHLLGCSIRQHTSAYVTCRTHAWPSRASSGCSIRQLRQHTSAYVSMRHMLHSRMAFSSICWGSASSAEVKHGDTVMRYEAYAPHEAAEVSLRLVSSRSSNLSYCCGAASSAELKNVVGNLDAPH